MKNTSVALLGLGTMGNGMAANLLRAGFPLTIYNRTAAKAAVLEADGARVATTPANAAKGATVIISMVADDAASRAVWLGEYGALDAAEAGAILIEASTLSPAWIAELAIEAKSRGLELLDAPVSGSRVQAEGRQLLFMVGGSEAALAKATPVLEALSRAIVRLGPVGSGATMKLINNFLAGVQAASLAEAIAWLERSVLDRDKALAILTDGSPGSPIVKTVSERMTRRDYSVNFLLKLMSKDLQYAHDAAAHAGVDLTTAVTSRAIFESAVTAGYGDEDIASVIEQFRTK